MTDVDSRFSKLLPKALATLFVVAISLSGIVACSSDSKKGLATQDAPRGVTTAEAQLLSRALSGNAEDKNASFVARSGSFSSGGFTATGIVSWDKSIVSVDVSLLNSSQVDLTVVETSEGVFEAFKDLYPGLDQLNLNSRTWVFRPLDISKYGVDALANFIAKLASQTPDNPLLLKQNGAQYLGTEQVGGVKTTKFQNTTAVTYFLTDQGELKKVTARIKGFQNDISIEFGNRKTSSVSVPDVADSYPLSDVESIYSQIRPPF